MNEAALGRLCIPQRRKRQPARILAMGRTSSRTYCWERLGGHGNGLARWRGVLHKQAKPLRGFGGAGVLEVVEDFDGNAYRAVYTVKLQGAVYVLHAFQKKSKRGSATPKADIALVKSRLRMAQEAHAAMESEK
jgi:phage-related protein